MLAEGIEAVTHLRVAAAGGGGRRTLYRYWPDANALLRDALLFGEVGHPEQTGDLAADLVAHLVAFSAALSKGHLGHIICALGERSYTHAEFEPMRAALVEAGCAPLKAMLRHGVADRQLPSNLDLERCLAVLEGPVLYEAIMHRRSTSKSAIEQAVQRFMSSPPLRTQKPPHRSVVRKPR
jgi:hypothetical protein